MRRATTRSQPAIYEVSEAEWYSWVLDHLEPRQRRIRLSVPLSGRFDADLASLAVVRVARRQAHLRSRFPVVDGAVVREELPAEVVSRPSPADTVDTPFALTEAPPFRWWAEEHEGRWVLVCDLHHIVADAAASMTIQEELAAAYEGVSAGREELPPSPPRLSLHPTVDDSRRATQYWLDLLEGAKPLVFPTPPRPQQPSPRRSLNFRLSFGEAAVASLARVAREARTTVPMLLLAYYVCVLQQCSLSDDLLLNYAFANRIQQEREAVDNRTLPLFLRLRLDAQKLSVLDVVRLVRGAVLTGIGHRQYRTADLWDHLTRSGHRQSTFAHWALLASRHYFNFYTGSEPWDSDAASTPLVRISIGPPVSATTALNVTQAGRTIAGAFVADESGLPLDLAQSAVATFLALCRAGSSALELRLTDVGGKLAGRRGDETGDPAVVVHGITVPLSEVRLLGEMALRGESGTCLDDVAPEGPHAVIFKIVADHPDRDLAFRFRRRLTALLLDFPHLALAGQVVVVDNRTDETVSTSQLSDALGPSRVPATETERLLCGLLSEVAGVPLGPQDAYIPAGGSLRDLPRIVAGMVELELPVPPMFRLFTSAPIEAFAAVLDRHRAKPAEDRARPAEAPLRAPPEIW